LTWLKNYDTINSLPNILFDIIISNANANSTYDIFLLFITEQKQKNVRRKNMDRRQRKTREAIFNAFTELLSAKDFSQITVGEIIERADIGRATFYSHFETKDFLLKEFCEELFCHIFDTENHHGNEHRHIFSCEGADSVFTHLFAHLQKNDNNILALLSSQNNELFLRYFRVNLELLIESQMPLFEALSNNDVPCSFWKNHIVSTFVETIKWWVSHGMKESPEVITEYFLKVV